MNYVFRHLILQLTLFIAGLVLIIVLFLAAVYMAYNAGKWSATPFPISVFTTNQEVFKDFVHDITQGKASRRADGQGFVISPLLADLGVRYVRDREGSIYFIFESLPTDATVQIIFIPNLSGFPDMPLGPQSNRKVLDFHRIDDNWYYLRTDW